ncbi:MAG: ribonuclease P protein component [Bacilli bacterium]
MKKQFRIKKNYEFDDIMRKKQFYSSPTLVLYVRKKKEEQSRVGITVGKKVGGAVARNKVKRQIRMMIDEVFSFEEEFDTIVLIRPTFTQEKYETNKKFLESAYKKVRIYK